MQRERQWRSECNDNQCSASVIRDVMTEKKKGQHPLIVFCPAMAHRHTRCMKQTIGKRPNDPAGAVASPKILHRNEISSSSSIDKPPTAQQSAARPTTSRDTHRPVPGQRSRRHARRSPPVGGMPTWGMHRAGGPRVAQQGSPDLTATRPLRRARDAPVSGAIQRRLQRAATLDCRCSLIRPVRALGASGR